MINKVRAILAARGKPLDHLNVRIKDDGTGPVIERWDESVLGPQPTQAELDAITDEQADSAVAAAEHARQRQDAVALLQSTSAIGKLIRAVGSEIAGEIRDMKAGSPRQGRTDEQILQAVALKILNGEVD